VVTPTEVYKTVLGESLEEGFLEIKESKANGVIEDCYDQIIEKMKSHLDPIMDKDVVNFLKNAATPKTSSVPIPYGLWKVHKLKNINNNSIPPMRLIVPVGKSILRGVSIYVDQLVRPLFNRVVTQNLKDTKSLLKILESSTYDPDVQIAVQDIVALYPSVDIDHGLQCFREFVSDSSFSNDDIDYIMTMTELIMRNNIVQFSQKFFVQIKGVAMGNPLAPTFASVWVHTLEKRLIVKYQSSGRLLLYKRLIDDSLSMFSSTHSCETFWREYNSLHHNLQTTGPALDNRNWEYLDLVIFKGNRFREQGKLDTRLHQKNYNRYCYLPFTSYHPMKSKGSWITAEAGRAIRACSCEKDYNQHLQIFARRLVKRGYPINFILHHLKRIKYNQRESLIFGESNKQAKEKKQQRTLFITHFNPTTNSFDLREVLRDGWSEVSATTGWMEPPLVGFRKERNLFSIFRKTLPG